MQDKTKLVIRAAKRFASASNTLLKAANHRGGFKAGSSGLARANAAYQKREVVYDNALKALQDIIEELS